MQDAGVIDLTLADWASPGVIALKRDGKLKICVDYRSSNAVAVKDSNLVPRMEDCIAALCDAALFTTQDCSSG